MNKLSLFACTLLLVSCVQREWRKPGADRAEFEHDLAVATYNANMATVGVMRGYSSPFLNSNQRAGESMANGVTRALEQQKLIRMYLQMNGWRLERVQPRKEVSQESYQESIANHEEGEVDYQQPNELE